MSNSNPRIPSAHTVMLAKQLEQAVYKRLLQKRAFCGETDYVVPAFEIFTALDGNPAMLTAEFFNRTVAQMKRLGIVGTTKNAGIFLSDTAWFSHIKEEINRLAKILVAKGIVKDIEEFKARAIEAGAAIRVESDGSLRGDLALLRWARELTLDQPASRVAGATESGAAGEL